MKILVLCSFLLLVGCSEATVYVYKNNCTTQSYSANRLINFSQEYKDGILMCTVTVREGIK